MVTKRPSFNVSRSQVFWSIVGRAIALGIGGGAALGAGYGVVLIFYELLSDLITWATGLPVSPLFPAKAIAEAITIVVFGGLVGVVAGFIIGLLNGMLLGAISSIWFVPVTGERAYRHIITGVSIGFTSFVALLCVLIAYHVPHPVLLVRVIWDDFGQFMYVLGTPIVLALGWAWYASQRVVPWNMPTATIEGDENDI